MPRLLEEAHDQGLQPLTALVTLIFHCSRVCHPCIIHGACSVLEEGRGGEQGERCSHARPHHASHVRQTRQTHPQTDRQRPKQTETDKDRKTHRLSDWKTHRPTDRPTRLMFWTPPILSTVELPLNKMLRPTLARLLRRGPVVHEPRAHGCVQLDLRTRVQHQLVALATSMTLEQSTSWALSHADVSCPQADNDGDTGRPCAGILPGGRVPRNFGRCQTGAS